MSLQPQGNKAMFTTSYCHFFYSDVHLYSHNSTVKISHVHLHNNTIKISNIHLPQHRRHKEQEQ